LGRIKVIDLLVHTILLEDRHRKAVVMYGIQILVHWGSISSRAQISPPVPMEVMSAMVLYSRTKVYLLAVRQGKKSGRFAAEMSVKTVVRRAYLFYLMSNSAV
jgi:hypothetical protein